jgi:hypothetical protein
MAVYTDFGISNGGRLTMTETTKQELLALAERVEKGEDVSPEIVRVFSDVSKSATETHDYDYGRCFHCDEPGNFGYTEIPDYVDDLTAAKALHDAVLPGWRFGIDQGIDDECCCCVISPNHTTVFGNTEHNPAAAWVSAILRAVAEEKDV